MCDVDRRRCVEAEERQGAVRREVTRAPVKRETEIGGALDAELHHDGLDEDLLPRRVEPFDHAFEGRVVV